METKIDFSDVLIVPKVSTNPLNSRALINLDISFQSYFGLPLIVSNMPSIGCYRIANILSEHRIVTFIYKDNNEDFHLNELKRMKTTKYIGLTTGIKDFEIQRILNVTSQIPVGFINLDTANIYGNFASILKATSLLKQMRPETLLVVGNVCTPEVVEALANAGADIIKVGVGSGSACLTRSEVGVGMPQLSAVIDVVAAAKKWGVGVISDGGCVTSGDICKALGAGANFVMLGGMLANSLECDNLAVLNGETYVNFWGLGSRKQFELTNTSEKEYRPNEGRNMLVPASKSILDTFSQIKGALRSLCTYVGSETIENINTHIEFIRVSSQLNTSLAKYEIN